MQNDQPHSQTKQLMAAHAAERQHADEIVHRPGKEHSAMRLALEAAELSWPGGLCVHGRAPGKLDPPRETMGIVLVAGWGEALCRCCQNVTLVLTPAPDAQGCVPADSATYCDVCHPDAPADES